ncbi:NRDE family protein [Oceanospirillum sp.]|uniref:NRDE family protein n=1 Tax=Oceanospirillum sp. TaxID=2021254 RepID=UPI003A9508E8
MCIILFSWQKNRHFPLVVAANRDEFYQRPTSELSYWENSDIIAGQDLQAGGTWLGITLSGRFAAVTNFRQVTDMHNSYPLSRGKLCQNFLEGSMSPECYLEELADIAMDTGGFNLLVSDSKTLGYGCNRFGTEEGDPYYDFKPHLPAGIYGLSNHRLDTPWPKIRQSKQLMTEFIASLPEQETPLSEARRSHLLNEEHLLPVITHSKEAADHELPDTGIGLDKERFLSPSFINSSMDYGTRASTILIRNDSGQQTIMEQTWHPGGQTGVRTLVCL